MTPPTREGPRVNEMINVPEVRLIDHNGENVGVVGIENALERAEQVELDLVELSPNANPPVCKILDFGKFKYQAQKKANVARKKQKTVDVKEIKMRPGIELHDYGVKMRSIQRFITEGDKVKVTLRFRGREMEHQNLGFDLLKKLTEEVVEYAKVEVPPKSEGKQIMMILVPQVAK